MAEYMRVYEFTKMTVQIAGSTISGTSATDTFTAGASHGLAVGDSVILQTVGDPALGVVVDQGRYFVVNVGSPTTFKVSATEGGSPITLGTAGGTTPATWKAIVEYQIPFANNAALTPENTDYTWEGDATSLTLSLLRGMSLALAADAIPSSAHKAIFTKTTISGALPGGGSNPYGYGGGNDRSGVTCGIRLEANGIKNVDGVETNVTFARWFPQGLLAFTAPAGLQTGQKMGTTGYSFTPSKVSVDVCGGTIAGVSSGGEFFIDYEL